MQTDKPADDWLFPAIPSSIGVHDGRAVFVRLSILNRESAFLALGRRPEKHFDLPDESEVYSVTMGEYAIVSQIAGVTRYRGLVGPVVARFRSRASITCASHRLGRNLEYGPPPHGSGFLVNLAGAEYEVIRGITGVTLYSAVAPT